MGNSSQAHPLSGTAIEPLKSSSAAVHLYAAAVATLLFVGAVAGIGAGAHLITDPGIAALGRLNFAQKTRGLLLQRSALRRGNVVPLYGSSEVADQRIGVFHAKEFFLSEPSGFSVFAVGGVGIPLLQTTVNLGALGNDLRGKKVAISMSADMFLQQKPLRNPGYSSNFSRLQALSVLLTPALSDPLKQRIAERLLQGPEPLE